MEKPNGACTFNVEAATQKRVGLTRQYAKSDAGDVRSGSRNRIREHRRVVSEESMENGSEWQMEPKRGRMMERW
jgi:hypothetical protein